ncbi:S8 family serine peptidase [Acetobacterium sp.]|uniref:S8 family serine peptidase n=1 Tax=Acetobacterium sp. TaxID=1872094 RepID=UPI000CAC6219|nr:S8 family serine peptidase [Acetobacterium sp.]MDO9493006.1 S8 family serine peptidase [Acetobacterium sp.]PKM71103.1 MAG: serine protease [Firmicutes bacterium HGW-Firmicutes-17]
MKFKKAIVFLLAMVLIGSSCPLGVIAESQTIVIQSLDEVANLDGSSTINDQIIVIYKDQATIGSLALTSQEIKGGETLNDQVDIIEVADSANTDALIAQLSENPNVLVAEKNSYIQTSALPNDPDLSKAWQFERIGADETWNKVNNTETVVVAVIDTGLNTQHPDIADNVITGYDYVEGTTDMVDLSGHGTLVSGCVAAVVNNGIGIAGIVGAANIKVAPYRVGGLSDGDKNLDVGYICAALYDAAARSDVKVINMSFGGYMVSSALRTAVENAANAGKVLVAAAGNEGSNANYSGELAVPASYNNVISVGATDNTNKIAYFSQHNSLVDLCAPGYKVYSTNHDGTYEEASGTSFASPITAGACAVLMAADYTMTSTQVETLLKETALDFGANGRDDYYGYGMIQLDAAMAKVTPSNPLRIDTFTVDKATGQTLGTLLTLNAAASGGEGDYQYGFYYDLNGKTTSIQDYSSTATATFTPTVAGIYTLSVQVLDGKGNTVKESIVNYVVKDKAAPAIEYRTHVQNVGWQSLVADGAVSGTEGKSLRLEAIEINTITENYDLGVKYKTHVQNIGWQNFVADGALSGTAGKSLRLEAIAIELTGTDADLFDVYYQVHAQNVGWMGWASNGQQAGTAGFSYRLEGIRIEIVPKGSAAPGLIVNPFIEK